MKIPVIVLYMVVCGLHSSCKQSSDHSESVDMVDIVRPVGNRNFTITDGRDRLPVRRLGQDEYIYYAVVDGDRSQHRPNWAWDASRTPKLMLKWQRASSAVRIKDRSGGRWAHKARRSAIMCGEASTSQRLSSWPI